MKWIHFVFVSGKKEQNKLFYNFGSINLLLLFTYHCVAVQKRYFYFRFVKLLSNEI